MMGKNIWETLVLLVRGFFLVLRSSPFLTPVILILGLFTAVEPLAHLWIMKLIVDKLASLASQGNLFGLGLGPSLGLVFKAAELGSLVLLLAIQLGIWIASRLISSVEEICSTRARLNFELYVQTRIMNKCSDLDLAFFENSANLDQLEKALRGSTMSAWNLVWMIFALISSAITMVSYLVVLFTLHWLAPVIVAVTTAPQMLSAAHFSRRRWKIYTEASPETRLRHYVAWLVGDKDSAKEIKLFGLSQYLIERYRFYCKKYYDSELDVEKRAQFINFLLGALSNVGTIVLWAFVLVRAAIGLLSAGDAFLFMSAAEHSRSYLLGFFSRSGRLYEHILFLSELFNFLDRKPESVDGCLFGLNIGERWGTKSAPSDLTQGIEFRNVSFTYPGTEKYVLSDVSFFLPKGKSIALVGQNGAGKTTLIKLLVRLYDPVSGDIFVDGKNIKEYDIESLRQMYSVVFQDYIKYYLTLRENIGFGDVEKVNDMAQVMWAAQKASADKIADKLPLGYETYLARQYGFKTGEDLSGGEWQKVALARSFMRESPVLVLDEPTAALDAFAEADLYKSFEELTRGKLSVIISHRFSTVKVASHIIVLDQGKLVDQGSHDELMERGGLYSEMYSAQADRYK